MKNEVPDGSGEGQPQRATKRGGYRPGCGRKRRGDPIVPYTVRISGEQADMLKRWGGGDLSAGLRWLVEAAALFVRRAGPPGGGK